MMLVFKDNLTAAETDIVYFTGFLVSDRALASLELTRDALLRILTYHQVMAAYIDFLLVYRVQDEVRELRLTGFRTRTILQSPVPGQHLKSLRTFT